MIKRNIYPQVKAHINKKEITIITGPRQAGKTTIMQMLIKELKAKGANCMYLNLDKEIDFKKLKSQEILTKHLELEFDKNTKSYIFIDEIQRKENAGLFLKGLYDSNLPYKFIVSGSGSVELKEKVAEGLAGRKKIFKLRTLSFKEFINYKTNNKYNKRLEDYFESVNYSETLLEEYLQFGGYPKLVTTQTIEQKRDTLESIYDSYITTDIRSLLNVKNTTAINELLTFLSTRIGNQTPTSEISNKINISYDTVKQYLYYLEKTFQIDVTRPFFKNAESEITKTPIYYFSDLGMRNFMFNRLSHYDPIVSGGMLFQNFVYLLLAEQMSTQNLISKINYWRTKDKAEIDLIANVGSVIIPIEVKYKDMKNTKVSKSMHSFIAKYAPEKILVVNKSLTQKVKVNNTTVKFVPYYKLVTSSVLEL